MRINPGVTGRVSSFGDTFSGTIEHNGLGVLYIVEPMINPTITGTGRAIIISDHEVKSRNFESNNSLNLGENFSAVHIKNNTIRLGEESDVGLRRIGAAQINMLAGDSFGVDGTWDGGRWIMGAYHLWIDATGALRKKVGAPTTDLDGTLV